MWLRIDEGSDVVISVSQCVRCLRLAASEPGSWKWAVLSFHNALQGSMVCHLNGTAALGALTTQCAGAWLEWHEKDRRGEINRVEQGLPVNGIRQFRFTTKADHHDLMSQAVDGRLKGHVALSVEAYRRATVIRNGMGSRVEVAEAS